MMSGRALAFLFALMACLGTASPSSAQAKGDPKVTKEKYEALCGSCHGPKGKGDGPAAVGLPVKPRDHTGGKYMNAQKDEYLFEFIKKGGAGMNKSPLMPAWGGQLSDQDIWNLVVYIRTLAVPPYRPAKK